MGLIATAADFARGQAEPFAGALLDGAGRVIDRAFDALDPVRGAMRARARMAIESARAYDAAAKNRRTAGWKTSGGSANAEILPALRTVRDRCRDVVRNNEYASRAVDSMVANTVGTGIIAKTRSKAEQARWDAWTQYCDADGQLDFNGLTELAHRTRREAGEAIVRFVPVDPDEYEIPLQIRVIEPDQLDDTKTDITAAGNIIIAGVEFDISGRRVAYWLYDVHPGEIAVWRLRKLQSRRVPASEVLHYFRKRRPSQVRALPELATTLLRIRDFSDYQYAQLTLKKMRSCFVGFVTTDQDNTSLGPPDSTKSPRQEKLSPGMIKYLRPGENVQFGGMSGSEDDSVYTNTQLAAIAVGAGTTVEEMTGDYSRFNFSSSRASKLNYVKLIEQEQWLALVPMMLGPIAMRWQHTALLAGKGKGAPRAWDWTMPRMQLGDPLKEALGFAALVRGGFMSLPEAIRELGYDPIKVAEESGEYKKELEKNKVLVDTDPAVSEGLLKAGLTQKLTQDAALAD